MASSLAWLDYSEEDQKRAREIVALFTQPESRDELGIGVVRDALADLMFPGVSVIQTRARYFLFVPWIIQEAANRRKSGQQLLDWVDRQERKLVESLRAGGDVSGLIGRVAGTKVKILPSTIYWNGLVQFGILRREVTQQQIARLVDAPATVDDVVTELVDRSDGLWDPNIPAWPDGFFAMDHVDFELTASEAQWLAERITTGAQGTLLAWLVDHPLPDPDTTFGPWDVEGLDQAPPELRRHVGHAQDFSLVMQGAALVYNVLLAQRWVEIGMADGEELLEFHRRGLDDWVTLVDANRHRVQTWEVADLWSLAADAGRPVKRPTKDFVAEWLELVRDTPTGKVATSGPMAALVRSREHQMKKGQSRLANDRLLRQWGGSSGALRLSFRWSQVLRLLGDIEEGRDRAGT